MNPSGKVAALRTLRKFSRQTEGILCLERDVSSSNVIEAGPGRLQLDRLPELVFGGEILKAQLTVPNSEEVQRQNLGEISLAD